MAPCILLVSEHSFWNPYHVSGPAVFTGAHTYGPVNTTAGPAGVIKSE